MKTTWADIFHLKRISEQCCLQFTLYNATTLGSSYIGATKHIRIFDSGEGTSVHEVPVLDDKKREFGKLKLRINIPFKKR